MQFIFSMPVLIRHLWQLKTVVFLHWCLICAVLLGLLKMNAFKPVYLRLNHCIGMKIKSKCLNGLNLIRRSKSCTKKCLIKIAFKDTITAA